MIYVLIAAIVIGSAAGFYGGQRWVQADWDAEKVARAEADAKNVELAAKLKQEQINHEQDMVTAFEEGQSKAKVVYRTVKERGTTDVTSYPVFTNRACDWPLASVQLINSAFASLRAPADLAVAPPTLPAPAPASGGATGSNIPMAPVAPGAVEPVRSDAGAVGGGNQGSTANAGRPPKPIPRAKH